MCRKRRIGKGFIRTREGRQVKKVKERGKKTEYRASKKEIDR